MLYIGIDLGTSAVKLLLMNEAGEILHVVSRDYPLEFPRPGWSQQNPADWQKAVWEGIPLLLEGFDGSPGGRHWRRRSDARPGGPGRGGPGHPPRHFVERRPDSKAGFRLERDRGQGPALPMDGPTSAFAGFTAPKLLWMREQEPELFARIKKVMLPRITSITS